MVHRRKCWIRAKPALSRPSQLQVAQSSSIFWRGHLQYWINEKDSKQPEFLCSKNSLQWMRTNPFLQNMELLANLQTGWFKLYLSRFTSGSFRFFKTKNLNVKVNFTVAIWKFVRVPKTSKTTLMLDRLSHKDNLDSIDEHLTSFTYNPRYNSGSKYHFILPKLIYCSIFFKTQLNNFMFFLKKQYFRNKRLLNLFPL